MGHRGEEREEWTDSWGQRRWGRLGSLHPRLDGLRRRAAWAWVLPQLPWDPERGDHRKAIFSRRYQGHPP